MKDSKIHNGFQFTKQTLLFVFIISCNGLFGQDSSPKESEGDMFSIDLIYGQHLLKNNFNSEFNSFHNYAFVKPIQSIGVSLSGAYTRGNRHDYAVHYSYSQIIPQRVVVNDSVSGSINGFILGLNMFGKDLLPKSKFANCIVSVGFNTGRFRLSGNEYKQQKNPFFSPTISVQPKIRIGPVVLSVRGDYSFDLSKKNWRSVNFTTKNVGLNMSHLKQTGGIIYFSIGFVPGKNIGYVWDYTKG
jgi:hypothetical protein